MIPKKIIELFFLCCFLCAGLPSMGQAYIQAYSDIGKTQVSDGVFVKTAAFGGYYFGKNSVGAGLQTDILSNSGKTLSAYSLSLARHFMIKEIPFNVGGTYILAPFSEITRESNLCFLIYSRPGHFSAALGTNFRTYAYTKKAREEYEIDGNPKLHENWNLMYTFGYYMKPLENPWNLSLEITNMDYFIINQETNPVFNLRAIYEVRPAFNLWAESWYKSSGAFNLRVNYFGFFFRMGVLWGIG